MPELSSTLKLLIIGSGAREHALVKAARRSPLVREVIATPGNAGMADEAVCHAVKADDVAGLVALAKTEKVNFVIVGPEVPLSLGLVDELAEDGIPAFGPKRAAPNSKRARFTPRIFCCGIKFPPPMARRSRRPPPRWPTSQKNPCPSSSRRAVWRRARA